MTSGRKAQIRDAFDAAAATYAQASGLQHDVAEALSACLPLTALPDEARVLEVGCGTGYVTRRLVAGCPMSATLTVTDLSPGMLGMCRAMVGERANLAFVAMDGENPSVTGPYDLIVSNVAVQWFDDPAAGVARLAGLLVPGGTLALTTFVTGTFAEWDAALRREGVTPPTLPFPPPEALETRLSTFGTLTVETVDHTVLYPSAAAFLARIKTIGAATPAPGHRPLTGGTLRRALRALDATTGPDGLAVTYRVFTAILTRT